ncbi:AraC family transcriptional regulator [Streptomyces sp. 110]|uniref:AraC family transcriptional regulator n=1 Tax=Streptomyces endocoffeicus TaxID=2898945 RepID=A0ABS1PGL5_9ACTN|nr:AraC family transcriptional regulator [Streptomyces endocoffeicus]MBL1111264.1 AraC family transcriptional regulator [Streptomyces endocoffeicus]
MADDQLSEVFDHIQIRGLMSSGFAARGHWVARGAIDHPLKFIAVARGRARLTTDSTGNPLALDTGDVAILNNQAWLELRGGAGDGPPHDIDVTTASYTSLREDDADHAGADVVLGGHVALNSVGRTLLLQALPPVGHVRASPAATHLRDRLDQILEELTGDRVGSAFAIRQHGQLLLLGMLRAYVDQAELPSGWLRALTDDRLRPALSLMHAEPAKPWRLETLASASAMSRTSFATHFRTVAGMPPLTYLNRWRMLLAQRALRDGDDPIGSLASDLGYTSVSAFSSAFKREVGESPLRYRHRLRDEKPAP